MNDMRGRWLEGWRKGGKGGNEREKESERGGKTGRVRNEIGRGGRERGGEGGKSV